MWEGGVGCCYFFCLEPGGCTIYIYTYIYIYIYLEPVCPLFLALTPSKTMAFPIKTRVIWVPDLQVDIQKVSHANTGRGRAMMGLEISCLFGIRSNFRLEMKMIIVYWMYGSPTKKMLKNPWFLSPHNPAFVKVLQLIFSVLGYPETEIAQCLPKNWGLEDLSQPRAGAETWGFRKRHQLWFTGFWMVVGWRNHSVPCLSYHLQAFYISGWLAGFLPATVSHTFGNIRPYFGKRSNPIWLPSGNLTYPLPSEI